MICVSYGVGIFVVIRDCAILLDNRADIGEVPF